MRVYESIFAATKKRAVTQATALRDMNSKVAARFHRDVLTTTEHKVIDEVDIEELGGVREPLRVGDVLF